MIFYPQPNHMDCGPSCLAMICSYYGKKYSLDYIREKSFLTREGVSLLGITEAAQNIGFETFAGELNTDNLSKDLLPCILHWNQNHFVVLREISKNIITGKLTYKIADPAHGFISLSEEKFKQSWLSESNTGIALFLEPNNNFFDKEAPTEKSLTIKDLLHYLKPYKKSVGWMLLLLSLGTIITLVFPILTQKLIDDGVTQKKLSVISYILLAQLAFFFGNIIINIFRNWIMLVVGTKINIQIISDFFKKLFQLPICFFDTKLMGDFNQRIQDHERIEHFLTSQSLLTIFSIITFTAFFGILWYYDFRILTIYMFLTIISVLWSLFWMRKRKILDYFRFQQRSENQESIYEIINGVSEMKLNQFEDFKRKEWEKIQKKLFKTNLRILKIDQIQLSGFEFINQIKNILVTFISAYLVVEGKMTLGALLSVSYIIGQMNSPVNQLISFFRALQDAKLSLIRLNEVQNHSEEEQKDQQKVSNPEGLSDHKKGFNLEQISFQYEGPKSPLVLDNINLHIPHGKITAIVGASGSGKTTLIKLLLKFYEPTKGRILINNKDLAQISPLDLRKKSGVVMQEGFIFSDTIARNIATNDEDIDRNKLYKSLEIANIKNFVEELPLGLSTKIGASGNGISGGQKQRVLIARAVYKDPQFIFFDEATSALDAENEKIIHDNLQSFFKGRTVIIVAHRLSTVKNADQIIVLKKGQIVEQGNHRELVSKQGEYFNLIKNQLELGN